MRCLPKLWKAECIQFYLAVYLNALNFWALGHSYLWNSSMNFREILEFSSIWDPLQTLKISDSKCDAFRSYGRLNVFNFTLACHVFKCVKILKHLGIRIFEIRQWIFEKFWNLVAFGTLYRPWKFQILNAMPSEVMEGRMYSILPCCVFKCIKFLSTWAFVSLKFVNEFSRNFGI